MNVIVLSGNFCRDLETFNRLADDLVILRVFGLDLRRDFHFPAGAAGGNLSIKTFAADQLAIGNLFRRIAHDADDTVYDGKSCVRDTQLRGGEFQQLLARGSGCLPDLRAGAFDAPAAHRGALFDGARSIAGIHLDARHRDVEFFGDDLGQRGDGAGADFDFTCVEGDQAIRGDGEPRVEGRRVDVAGWQGGKLSEHFSGGRKKVEADDECAGGFEKLPAGD